MSTAVSYQVLFEVHKSRPLHLCRLLIPGLAQGMLMLDRGDGSVEDIDRSLELGAGHPMGPLTLAVSWASRGEQ